MSKSNFIILVIACSVLEVAAWLCEHFTFLLTVGVMYLIRAMLHWLAALICKWVGWPRSKLPLRPYRKHSYLEKAP